MKLGMYNTIAYERCYDGKEGIGPTPRGRGPKSRPKR